MESGESLKVSWTRGQDRFPHLRWRLDEEAFSAFRRFGEERVEPAGAVIFEAGQPSFSLYLVIEGEIEITQGDTAVATLGENHSFGELGLLRDAPRSGGARAKTDARLLELSRQGLHKMLHEAPVWAARLYRVLAECLAEYFAATASKT